MSVNIIAKVSKRIDAPARNVWDALTNPEKIRQYFFNTHVVSDWREGSDITFEGEWEGKHYKGKGTIQMILPEKVLQFSYFSPLSGQEDTPENYQNITYELDEDDGYTILTVRNSNLPSEDRQKQAEKSWETVLENLKSVVESTATKERLGKS